MRVRGWALSDVGRTRDHNEDSYLCNDALGLYGVADGMGGHLGGERASRMAVDILEEQIGRGIALGVTETGDGIPVPGAAASIKKALHQAVIEATRAIWALSQREAALTGMGTTLTGILFHGGKATLAHVGDSRAYLFRHGQVRQLTEDHSWIAEQVRAGLLAPDDALTSRFRNIITRSVGFEQTVQPDLLTIPVEAGDCFVLCSDGMSNHVGPEELAEVLAHHFYAEAPARLVELANERGGEDNVTVVTIYAANQPPQ